MKPTDDILDLAAAIDTILDDEPLFVPGKDIRLSRALIKDGKIHLQTEFYHYSPAALCYVWDDGDLIAIDHLNDLHPSMPAELFRVLSQVDDKELAEIAAARKQRLEDELVEVGTQGAYGSW